MVRRSLGLGKYALLKRGYPLELYDFLKMLFAFCDDEEGYWCRNAPDEFLTSLILLLLSKLDFLDFSRTRRWLLRKLNEFLSAHKQPTRLRKPDYDRVMLIAWAILNDIKVPEIRDLIREYIDVNRQDGLWYNDPFSTSISILLLFQLGVEDIGLFSEFVSLVNSWLDKRALCPHEIYWVILTLKNLRELKELRGKCDVKATIKRVVIYLEDLMEQFNEMSLDNKLWVALSLFSADPELARREGPRLKVLYDHGKLFAGQAKEFLYNILGTLHPAHREYLRLPYDIRSMMPDLITLALFASFYSLNNNYIVYHLTEREYEQLRQIEQTEKRLKRASVTFFIFNVLISGALSYILFTLEPIYDIATILLCLLYAASNLMLSYTSVLLYMISKTKFNDAEIEKATGLMNIISCRLFNYQFFGLEMPKVVIILLHYLLGFI